MHLYLHIPFCHHICPYCGFYKHKPGRLANRNFVDALLAEAGKRASLVTTPIETVYFGGGTPSLLSPSHLERLFSGLHKVFALDSVREWTLEANPATFDLEKARLMRSSGVSRISLGIQSFQPDILATLGRDHTPDQAREAFHTLREAGFENISVDLMFSIPGQDMDRWKADLEEAVALQPNHISAYNLNYEEDTEFLERHEAGELDASEDRDATLFYAAIDFLEVNGFDHYEISNYARPGFESLHNQAYWSGADYLGLGPSAVSTLDMIRSITLPDTAAYVKAALGGIDTRSSIEELSEADKHLERVALQLRTRKGIPRDLVASTDPVDLLIQQGLVAVDSDRIYLTREGKALADPIAGQLV